MDKEETTTPPIEIAQNGESGSGIIDEARVVNKSLGDNLDKYKELLDRHETMKIKEQLAGKADAGEVVEKKETTAAEYALEVLAGKHNG